MDADWATNDLDDGHSTCLWMEVLLVGSVKTGTYWACQVGKQSMPFLWNGETESKHGGVC